MNAGDELRLAFPALAAAAEGLDARLRAHRRRLGEGRRLQHQLLEDRAAAAAARHPDYKAASATPTLEEDPVYQRHRDDWQTFHTRFVTPERF